MKRFGSSQRQTRARAGSCAALAVFAILASALFAGADPQTPAPPAASATNAPVAKTEKAVVKKLDGAELYAINCGRCHPERYPTEFNSAQWKTLMLHMRVRANLPAQQAKLILKYLQDESGN